MADNDTPTPALDSTPSDAPASPSDDQGASPAPAPSSDWREALPEDLRGAKALRDVKDVGSLAKSYLEAQSHLGNAIRIPSEHASPEDVQAFHQRLLEKVPGLAPVDDSPEARQALLRRLGAPEEATGYALPENMPKDGVRPVEGFNEWAHEASLTQDQFATLATRFTEAQLAQAEERAAAHNANMEALHREWGFAAQQKTQDAIALAKLTGAPPDFVEAMENNRVAPEWVRYMAELSDRFGGEADVGQDRGNAPRELTPSEAQSQYDEIMRNREHPFWTAPHGPERDRVLAHVSRLKELAMGPGSRQPHAELGRSATLFEGSG